MVLHHVNDNGVDKLVVHVDTGFPQAWRKEPYYSHLKRWSRELADRQGMLNLYIGRRVIAFLPDKEVDLGIFDMNDRVIYKQRRVPSGWEFQVEKVTGNTSTG
jgi:hypothetical protein